jgi:DNA polymerase-3 subunit alpha
MNYAPLHLHTHFSLFDGIGTPEEYINRAVSLSMPAVAITDHGTLSGHREFYRIAKEKGVKPILGLEGYMCADISDRRDKSEREGQQDLVYNHIILLAKNQKGLENLNKISELAWTDGFFKKPRFDFNILEKHKEGIIVSSACPSSVLVKALEENEFAIAKKYIAWFKNAFGADYYIEVMPHNKPEINKYLIDLADEFDIKVIVTPDCHHVDESQREIQEFKLLMNTHAKVAKDVSYEKAKKASSMMDRLDALYGKDREMTFKNFNIHLLSYEEIKSDMKKQGIDREDIYSNTLLLAETVEDYNIKDGLDLLPAQYKSPDQELSNLAFAGLEEKKLTSNWLGNDIYEQRLDEELHIIREKKFAPYFLVVQNMIDWAKKEEILVGPGRGSSAGSLVCYLLGITEIDPIEHDLLFFRFINPERNDFPDIDTDIQDSRREDVKDYLVRQYRHVASIATFLSFKDKGVVRDVARVLNIPLTDVNKVLKTIDTWDEYCRSKTTLWFRDKYPEVEVYGEQLRGRIRGTGIHAAGVVTSKEPIFRHAPMETRSSTGSNERIPVVGIDMEEAEKIGLIKIDALGLKTLSVMKDCIDIIKEREGTTVDLLQIKMDDAKVYEMLSDGYTKGVFQCEAAPYTNLLVKMRVKNFSELAASNALVRPGAMNTIGKDYIARKHGRQNIDYLHQILKPLTEETYGCILYQEQVMQACVELGGMTMAEADKVRKIIGKKKDAREFDEFKDRFIKGASKYITPNAALDLWQDFEAHAGYSFNKSHAVAYSTLSYWTAWLKYYYPLEFMFALLKNEKDKDTRTEYLIEAKRMGITIKLPHVNESDVDFKIEGKGIRFGLSAIKWISGTIAERYIAARPFTSYEHVEKFTFTKGNGVNSRALQAMNCIGALTFTDNSVDQAKVKENLYEYLNLPEFNVQIPQHYYAYINDVDEYEEKGAFILMGMVKSIKRAKGWSRIELLDKTGSVGIFDEENTTIEAGRTYLVLANDNRVVSAIPVDEVSTSKDPLIKFLNYKMLPYKEGEHYVVSFKPRVTKAGKKMASLTVADAGRELHAITVFPTAFAKAYMHVQAGNVYKFEFKETKEGTRIMEDVVNV